MDDRGGSANGLRAAAAFRIWLGGVAIHRVGRGGRQRRRRSGRHRVRPLRRQVEFTRSVSARRPTKHDHCVRHHFGQFDRLGRRGVGSSTFADGAAYIPFSNSWVPVAASPLAGRWTAAVAWTGNQEIIFGGTNGGGSFFSDGARYNPVTDTWTRLDAPPLGYVARIYPAWSGINGSLVLYGGILITGNGATDGLAYDALGHPTTIATPPTAALNPSDRYGGVLWCSDAMATCWLWGGASAATATTAILDGTGAAFTYPGLAWTPMPTAAAPTARVYASSVWTGKSGIVWGGLDDTTSGAPCTNTGALYTP